MSNLDRYLQPDYSERAQALLARAPGHFIDGDWVAAGSDARIDVRDPSSGRVVSSIADASDAEVDAAVAAARRAFDDGRWTGLPPIAREGILHALAAAIDAHADELAELEAIDNGKPRGMAGAIDLPWAASIVRYMAGWPTRLAGECHEPATTPGGAFHSYVRREPIGVAGLIVPWNFPLAMAVMKVAPALAAGCTAVLKPAEQTSLTALRLAELARDAGVPPGVLNVVTGRGAGAGERLVRHPDVDKIGFTGSIAIGKHINRTATDTLKRVTLELGGKSPVIVFPDVDVDAVAAATAQSIFFNSGQVCVAGSRLLVHSSIYDAMLEALARHAGAWQPGASLREGCLAGPLVSEAQRDRVMHYIDDSRKRGASIVSGGDAPAADGYYVNPTVIADVSPDLPALREEIFGPVLVAQRFDDMAQAVAMANDSRFGLAASVWTRDVSTMHKVSAQLKTGTVWGNAHGVMDQAMAFGGRRESGLGREHGRHSVEAYTELKSVIIAL
ncbi:MAG: aldehyde dehydrogenase family protein [Gammaproteobacteria bacterium]|nr:aldehyde dehydrogenase family protein [Gammaproteobacteria bacterium]